MIANEYWTQFQTNIKLPAADRSQLSKKYHEMKGQLEGDDVLKPAILDTFQQGSFARHTALGPCRGERADLDIVVVTKLSKKDNTPKQALDKFTPFLDKHYEGKHEQQGRSIGIELGEAKVDLVVTSDPPRSQLGILKAALSANALDPNAHIASIELVQKAYGAHGFTLNARDGALLKMAAKEPEMVPTAPLEIPDLNLKEWQPTNPMAQYHWTVAKNARCGGHYIEVVRGVKWWRKLKFDVPKYPKGYPLEHLIGENCPDGISSAAEGFTRTLESISTRYLPLVQQGQKPVLNDRGVVQDVFLRISADEFRQFYNQVTEAAAIARAALDAKSMGETVDKWQELFGDQFPSVPGTSRAGASPPPFQQVSGPAKVPPRSFA